MSCVKERVWDALFYRGAFMLFNLGYLYFVPMQWWQATIGCIAGMIAGVEFAYIAVRKPRLPE